MPRHLTVDDVDASTIEVSAGSLQLKALGHALAGAQHATSTIAELNAKVSDATLMTAVIDDTTPQLGGDLDANTKSISNILDLTVTKSIYIPTTVDGNIGVIKQNSLPFLHTYGTDNLFLGQSAGNFGLLAGTDLIGIGREALANIDGGVQSIAVGREAGKTSVNGSRNVFLGYKAGYYETGNDKLFIDDRPRTNEADARVKALIYGIFDALTANQYLYINGNLSVLEGLDMNTQKIINTGSVEIEDGGWIGLDAAKGRIQFDDETTDFISFLTCYVGIGTTTPARPLEISADGEQLRLTDTSSAAKTNFEMQDSDSDGHLIINVIPVNGTDAASIRLFRDTNTSGDVQLDVYKGNGANTRNCRFSGNGDSYMAADNGTVGIKTASPSANADLTLGVGVLCMAETTTPTADVNFGKFYTTVDNKFFVQDGAGVEHELFYAPSYGEIWFKDNAGATTLNSAAIVQVTDFDTNGVERDTDSDYTNAHIVIEKVGTYLVTVSLSVINDDAQSHTLDISCFKNNGATELGNLHSHRSLAGGSGDVGAISISGLVTLAVNDTLELWATTDSGVNRDVIFEDCTMSVVQIDRP